MLVGKWRRANDASADTAGQHGGEGPAGLPYRVRDLGSNRPQNSPLNFGKRGALTMTGNELASNESYQMVNSFWRFST
jgi:hypothetical protein